MGGGCSPLPSRPQEKILLTLEAPKPQPLNQPRKKQVLLLEHVNAVASLRQTNILYRSDGPSVSYFANHRWLAMPADLIDQALMESLAPRLPYASVVRPEQGLAANRALSLVLLHLEQAFTANGQSHERLEMLAQLLDLNHGRVIGSRIFRYLEPAPTATAEGGALAAGTALSRLFDDLRAWLGEVDP
ncbi:MAG: hypothetical protein AXA67_10585 [Methylothermaceae bacteria B42]|nr:MAG: hypothetical protein AXA67_10585 [Methylothermaceae bacteria B42]